MTRNRRVGRAYDYAAGYGHIIQLTGWTYEYIDAMPFPRFFQAAQTQPIRGAM